MSTQIAKQRAAMPAGANKILDERTIANDNRNLLSLLKKNIRCVLPILTLVQCACYRPGLESIICDVAWRCGAKRLEHIFFLIASIP